MKIFTEIFPAGQGEKIKNKFICLKSEEFYVRKQHNVWEKMDLFIVYNSPPTQKPVTANLSVRNMFFPLFFSSIALYIRVRSIP